MRYIKLIYSYSIYYIVVHQVALMGYFTKGKEG